MWILRELPVPCYLFKVGLIIDQSAYNIIHLYGIDKKIWAVLSPLFQSLQTQTEINFD